MHIRPLLCDTFKCRLSSYSTECTIIKVVRYSFSGSIPLKFERKLRRHKQRFGKIDITVVLDKDNGVAGLQ